MEEIRNFEEVTNETMEVAQEAVNSGNGVLGYILGGLVVAGVTAFVAHKTKDKLEAKKIEKLRKKGYVIYKAEEEDFESDDADMAEEEK